MVGVENGQGCKNERDEMQQMDQNWYWKLQWSIYNLVNGRVSCEAEQIFSRGEIVQGKKAVEVAKDVMRKEENFEEEKDGKKKEKLNENLR